MAHTHTITVNVRDIAIEGEITFDGGEIPSVSFSDAVDMQIKELSYLGDIFVIMTKMYRQCGEITKFEINKK